MVRERLLLLARVLSGWLLSGEGGECRGIVGLVVETGRCLLLSAARRLSRNVDARPPSILAFQSLLETTSTRSCTSDANYPRPCVTALQRKRNRAREKNQISSEQNPSRFWGISLFRFHGMQSASGCPLGLALCSG